MCVCAAYAIVVTDVTVCLFELLRMCLFCSAVAVVVNALLLLLLLLLFVVLVAV